MAPSTSYGRRLLALFALVAVIGALQWPWVIPMTESVRYHLLMLDPGPLHTGDYVNLPMRHPLIDADRTVILTKRIACRAGHQLEFRRGVHYCDGRALGTVLARTRDGDALTPFKWSGTVPPGAVFVSGDHVRSFDSRYFGFVPEAALTRLRPLL